VRWREVGIYHICPEHRIRVATCQLPMSDLRTVVPFLCIILFYNEMPDWIPAFPHAKKKMKGIKKKMVRDADVSTKRSSLASTQR